MSTENGKAVPPAANHPASPSPGIAGGSASGSESGPRSGAGTSAGILTPGMSAGTITDEPGPKERILQAALELFVEQGYFNTNVPDISKRSRCSVGSIYHHFLNKEEIAGKLYDAGIQRFRKALSAVVDADQNLESNIQNIVIAFLEFAESHLILSRYLWLSRHHEFLTADLRHPTTVGFDELGRKLTRVIKRGERAGEIPPLKAEVLWSILFGIPVSYVRDWLDGYTKSSPKAVAPLLARACCAALIGGALAAESSAAAEGSVATAASSKDPQVSRVQPSGARTTAKKKSAKS